MNKLISILILFFAFNSASGQTEWQISSKGVGPVQLGESIEQTRSQVSEKYTTTDNEKNGFDIYDDNKRLISVWSKRTDGTIGFIEITSDKFQTKDGLKAGLTITEVEKLRGDFVLQLDEMSGEAFFKPTELQTPSDEYYSNLNLLYFKSTDGEDLVTNYKYDERSKSLKSISYRKNGVLEYFFIYQWK